MAPVLDALDQHRGIASLTTVEDVATVYRNLTNCDPERDMVCAEVDGRLVAYSRVTWWDEVADQVAGQVRSFSTPPRTIRSGAIAATRSSSR